MKDVIVIGAGISAYSAAARLVEAGIDDFVILEASGRIGGRMHTLPFENHYVEIGCQWIHGQKENPIYELAENLGQVDETEDNGTVYYATQDGKELDPDVIENFSKEIEDLFERDLIAEQLEKSSNISLGEALHRNFDKKFEKIVSNTDLSPELIKAIYKSRYNLERLESGCDDLQKLSAAGWENYESFEGDGFTKLKNGYSKLIEHLKAQVPKDSLKLNQRVTKIEYNLDNGGVRVTALNPKNNERTTYEAKYVLCTIPLGVLKDQHGKIFEPRLPDEKIRAIENLGFGVLNKFFFVFDQNLDENLQGLQIYWQDNLNFELEANKKWKIKDSEFYKCFENFIILPHCPNVLLGLVAGNEGIFSESLSDECLIDVFSEILTKCFPKLKLPRPKQLIRSKWSSEEFAKGSYTYISTRSSIEDVEHLAEPLDDRLFFAGESTTYKYMGTVHGAYISGKDAAKKIIKSIKGSSRPASKMSNRPSSSRSNRPSSSRSNRPTSSSSRRD